MFIKEVPGVTAKEKLIGLLEGSRGTYISGEELAERIGCSRAAVWKAVKQLKAEGYAISAVTNKGYCLAPGTDMLSEAAVRRYLRGAAGEYDIRVVREVGSTNTELRKLAEQGAPEGTCIIAMSQTGGKGRMGRRFCSPADTGLYLSLLLRPQMSAAEAVRITAAAAVAVAGACEELSGRQTGIKWVNDVCIGGRKVCGILTEASFSLENGGLDYAVVGLGVNVLEPAGGFPESIADIACAVFDESREDLRSRLAGEIVSRLAEYYHSLGSPELLEEYRKRLMWVGGRITVIGGTESFGCTMLGVNEDFSLNVRLDDGSVRRISSGEISIRKQEQGEVDK